MSLKSALDNGLISYAEVKPLPFDRDVNHSGFHALLSENEKIFGVGILSMILCIVLLFLMIKQYRRAWRLATVIAPCVSLFVIACTFNSFYLLLFYFLPFIMIFSAVLSAAIGYIFFLIRKKKCFTTTLAFITLSLIGIFFIGLTLHPNFRSLVLELLASAYANLNRVN